MKSSDRSFFTALFIAITVIIGVFTVLFANTMRNQNAELRSHAQGPYDPCAALCRSGAPQQACNACREASDPCYSVCHGGGPLNACNACRTANNLTPFPTPTVRVMNDWDKCVVFPNDGTDACIKTYKQLKAEKDEDWRCKSQFIDYGMCPDIYNIEWPSGTL